VLCDGTGFVTDAAFCKDAMDFGEEVSEQPIGALKLIGAAFVAFPSVPVIRRSGPRLVA
jgi:hypothetical protein